MSKIEGIEESREPGLRTRVPVRPLVVPAELLGADPNTDVRYEHGTSCWISGSGVAKAGALIAEIEATIARQSRGCFHPDEAAHLIAEAQDIDSRPLLNRMEEAFKQGKLIIREPGTELQRNPSEPWSRASDLVLASDIDDWLSRQGASYRFPRVEAKAKSAPPVDSAISPQLFQIMFDRLERTSSDFRGGRIADIDVLELPEAARMASRHAKAEVTVKDILRAAARGEIPLKAVVHHRGKVYKDDGGICINRGHPIDENVVPAGSIPTLPLVACQHLANAGRASWRTFDGVEFAEGERWRFTKFQLTPETPSFETTVADCRISGYDLHALADAFHEDEVGNISTADVAQVSNGAASSIPAASISHSTKSRRRDLLDLVIDEAQAKCSDKWDKAEVWLQLLGLAKARRAPLIGIVNEGLQYEDGEEWKIFKKSALTKRLERRAGDARKS
jgi:hypothetical protein